MALNFDLLHLAQNPLLVCTSLSLSCGVLIFGGYNFKSMVAPFFFSKLSFCIESYSFLVISIHLIVSMSAL